MVTKLAVVKPLDLHLSCKSLHTYCILKIFKYGSMEKKQKKSGNKITAFSKFHKKIKFARPILQ